MFSKYKNNCCHCKSLLHAKPLAIVNTAVHVGGVYATDKLRRVELYREEVSNKQLYNCILRDVSCSALIFIERVCETFPLCLNLSSWRLGVSAHYFVFRHL